MTNFAWPAFSAEQIAAGTKAFERDRRTTTPPRSLRNMTPQQAHALCRTAVVRPRTVQLCPPKPAKPPCLVSRHDTASLQRFLQRTGRRVTMAAHLTDVLRVVIAKMRFDQVTRLPAVQVVAALRNPGETRMQDADTQGWAPDCMTGVSPATAKRQLGILVEAGKLVRMGRYLTTPRLADLDAERARLEGERMDAVCHRRARRAAAERARRVAHVGSKVSQGGPRICSTAAICLSENAEGVGMDFKPSLRLGMASPALGMEPEDKDAVVRQAPWPHGAADSPCRPRRDSTAHSSDPAPAQKSVAAGATDPAAADAGRMPADRRTDDIPHVRVAVAAAFEAVHRAPDAAPSPPDALEAESERDDDGALTPAQVGMQRAFAALVARQAAYGAAPDPVPAPPPAAPPAAAQRPAAPPAAQRPAAPPGGRRPCDVRHARALLEHHGLTLSDAELRLALGSGATYDQLRRAVEAYREMVLGGSAPHNGPAPYLKDTCLALRAQDAAASRGRS